jgi:hypothetical protein
MGASNFDRHGRDFGHLKLKRFLCFDLVISPDICMWIFPTLITVALFSGGLAVAGHVPLERWGADSWMGRLDLYGTCGGVIFALFMSLLCGLTDPGAIPRVPSAEAQRLRNLHQQPQSPSQSAHTAIVVEVSPLTASPTADGESADSDMLGMCDPYSHETGWNWCRVCNLRRPPRTSHCHTCGVCVLEHDHHCGVIGGCVGLRSLRYFTAYLLTTGGCALNTLTWILMGLISASGNGRMAHNMAPSVMLLIFIGNITLMVGGLGLYYLYLVISDTTRREAQRGKAATPEANVEGLYYHEDLLGRYGARDASRLRRILGNFGRVFDPPPSLIHRKSCQLK